MTGASSNQRSLLICLAIGAMAERTGSDVETAEEALNRYPAKISGDEREVTLSIAGEILIRVSRAWLAEIGGQG